MNREKNNNFEKERQQTDESLNIERGKTDESFNSGRGNMQERTNQVVMSDRNKADKFRSELRSAADSRRESEASTSSTITEEHLDDLENALENQRNSEDKALARERSKMDNAIEFERGEKEKLMNLLVKQEREATDKNLRGERKIADIATQHSASLLTVEHEAHLQTRSELTTREELIAVVSHDLRNPIGAILSSADILLEDFANELNGDAKSLIQLIKRNAETSMRLVSDILEMERIVEGKLVLELSVCKIDDVINQAIESYAHSASAKKILLKASPSGGSTIFCDKDRIAQILSNLIGNALKFTPEGGLVNVKAQESKHEITFSVRDTGPGVAEDKKTKIFERFAQLNDKTRGGIGLGLYISKNLVEAHLGKLWITSTVGSGSTFWFTIPIQDAELSATNKIH